MMNRVLILYYSRNGSTKQLAHEIAVGVDEVEGAESVIRTVPSVSPVCDKVADSIPCEGVPYVTLDDLNSCSALALGSPTRFGAMAAPVKYFLETTTSAWLSGKLVGKPAAVFTSSSSLHGGQESTLLSMMMPLFHHGMIVMGLPFTESELSTTRSGGTPYGASHVQRDGDQSVLTADEVSLSRALGRRLAKVAVKLS